MDIEYKKLIKELDAYPVDQFDNMENPNSYYYTTASEIINDLPSVEAFVDYVGTGGTLCGVSKRLKEHNNKVICASIIPDRKEHIIQGGGYFKEIPFLEDNLVDLVIEVSEEEALIGMNYLSKYEAICGGISSGANLIGAIKLLEKNENKKVVFLINDISLKYNSILLGKKD